MNNPRGFHQIELYLLPDISLLFQYLLRAPSRVSRHFIPTLCCNFLFFIGVTFPILWSCLGIISLLPTQYFPKELTFFTTWYAHKLSQNYSVQHLSIWLIVSNIVFRRQHIICQNTSQHYCHLQLIFDQCSTYEQTR